VPLEVTREELERAPLVAPESVVSEQGAPVEEPAAVIHPTSPGGRLLGWIARAVRAARRIGRRVRERLG